MYIFANITNLRIIAKVFAKITTSSTVLHIPTLFAPEKIRAFMRAALLKRSCSAPYIGIPTCRPASADGLLSPPSSPAGSSRRPRGQG